MTDWKEMWAGWVWERKQEERKEIWRILEKEARRGEVRRHVQDLPVPAHRQGLPGRVQIVQGKHEAGQVTHKDGGSPLGRTDTSPPL